MKKTTPIYLALFLTFILLSACGPDANENSSNKNTENSEENKPDKLVVWEDEDKEAGLEPAIESFEDEYDIDVEFKTLNMADDMKDQLALDGPAGSGPDVLTLPHDQIGELAKQGMLAPMQIEDSVVNEFTDTSIEAETYQDELYGLPKADETLMFFYNKEHMDEAPKTFDEVMDFAKDFTEDDKYGFLFNPDDYYQAHGFLSAYGGYIFKEENGKYDTDDLGLNNDGAVEGTEWIKDWFDEDLFTDGILGDNGGSALDGLFNEGKVAAKLDGPWAIDGMEEAGIDYGVATLPELPNGKYPESLVGVKGWHVSNFSEHKEWATKLTEWLTNEENAKTRYEETSEIPPVEALEDEEPIKDDPVAKAIFTQSERGEPTPNNPEMGEVWEVMADKIQLAVTDKQDTKKALDDGEATINSKIKELQEE